MKIDLHRLANNPAPIRLGCFILTLLIVWLPIAVPIYSLVSDSNLVTISTIPPLYLEFILLLKLWGKYVDQQPHIFQHYGLERTRQNRVDLLLGLTLALISLVILFGVEGLFGYLVWQQPKVLLLRVILEGLVVGLGYGFAEELLFRGWLLDELQRDYSLRQALWINAFVFATLHFVKPLEAIIHTLPQFPALVLLGLTLCWGKRWRRGRLGLPIGLHGGLVGGNYIINVGQLIKYSGQVPDWVTGINKNPLAGVMGLLLLSVLAFWMNRRKRASDFRS